VEDNELRLEWVEYGSIGMYVCMYMYV